MNKNIYNINGLQDSNIPAGNTVSSTEHFPKNKKQKNIF